MGISEVDLMLLADKWRGQWDILKRVGHEHTPDKPRKQIDEDAPLSEHDREAIRSVRCEHCTKVLPYGTRPYEQLDDPEAPHIFLCKRCVSDHENRYYREPDGTGAGWPDKHPAVRTCTSLVISSPTGRVINVLVGCGEKTSEWTESSTRTLIHKDGCQRYKHELHQMVQPEQGHA